MSGRLFSKRRREESAPLFDEDEFTRSYYDIEKQLNESNDANNTETGRPAEVIGMTSPSNDMSSRVEVIPQDNDAKHKKALIGLSLTVVILIVLCVCLVYVLFSLKKTNEYLNQFNQCVRRNQSGDRACQTCARKCLTPSDD
uniref:uncharacterized protein LOC120338775 n=1 Tax=Styela clava TaxID=7725 RepID=UPI001939F3C1|nr:uncharacterized protein LOC120338775 [Styela clava]